MSIAYCGEFETIEHVWDETERKLRLGNLFKLISILQENSEGKIIQHLVRFLGEKS